jgi:hypothetical protein
MKLIVHESLSKGLKVTPEEFMQALDSGEYSFHFGPRQSTDLGYPQYKIESYPRMGLRPCFEFAAKQFIGLTVQEDQHGISVLRNGKLWAVMKPTKELVFMGEK